MSLTSANPDNANPIVHKTAAGRRSKLGDFLDEEDSMTFNDDYDDGFKNGHDLTYSGSSDSESSEEATNDKAAEDIDAEEIYGDALRRSFISGSPKLIRTLVYHIQISYAPSQIPNIHSLSNNWP